MEEPFTCKGTAVLFDLDNTLFDHQHSLSTAIQAIQNKCHQFASFKTEQLIETYERSLQKAYDSYLRGDISYDEKDIIKLRSFFGELGLPEPDQDKIKEFKAVYKVAYRESRRATPGSIETLIELKKACYQLAIVTNGQTTDQNEKAEAIGVASLVDRIFTSQEVGEVKPDPWIFEGALNALDCEARWSFMVGDDPKTDIQGAINQGKLFPFLYNPRARTGKIELHGREVTVLRDMRELLPLLGIYSTSTVTRISSLPEE
jgi:HAD superfamily hydrolase (TIGR01549 family)